MPLKGYTGEGVVGAPRGPKRKVMERGDVVPLGPYGFRSMVRGEYGGRGRGGGIVPGVVQGGGRGRGSKGGSTGIAWISSGLGTLAPRPR